MDFNLFSQMIRNVTGKNPESNYYSTNIESLNTHYSNILGTILPTCKNVNAKIIDSTAAQLLQEQWASEDRCIHCGQAEDMYDAYSCLSCNLRMYPDLDRDQKHRAEQIAANPKKYHKLEILWAEKILKRSIIC